MDESLEFGPNTIHVTVMRGGVPEDLGWFPNLRTTAGMDFLHASIGGATASAQGSPLTGSTATSGTATGSPWLADELIGKRIVVPVTGLTTAPVWGNILDNTASVVQVDGWWTSAEGTAGTTPASTSAFLILPGSGSARWIGLTDNSAIPAVTDTSLTSEITATGLARAITTYAHTAGSTQLAVSKTWTASGAVSCRKAGLFSGGYGAAGGGVLVCEAAFTAVTLASSDTLTITWTFTLPAAG